MNNLIHHEKVQDILQNVPALFRKFSPDDLRGFFITGELETFQSGEIVTREASEQVHNGWLIADGVLSVWTDNIKVASLGPGDFIGEEFLFSKGVRAATVKAESDVALIRFDRESVIDFFRTRPERIFKIFIMNLLEIQQRKIKSMNNKVARLQRKLAENNID
ncbi:Crp/Fnr family transcriptional regulator [Natronogracilivirga saccharolytica]|uniref:Cyclic nucleotide-binding domain-containing protein n=1 Tax=Natronogracilivirga saccharolytica TaxID=2812953 RepID=A0A8J7S7Z0_9BACT|nr:cyclic nucleotide-binding domain-containing protein [Natronogracilivirga saccharolytica]MBP3191903.1 cyclic nucleotide-binding domain-containing protein [Natronogracilivirga saccharolytica]